MKLFDIINIPLGYVLRFFAEIMDGNFAFAVFLFTLLIDLVLIPLNINGQKSAVQQMRMKPKLDEIKKKYGDDRQKFAEAQQKLYQNEGATMSGGCLPMLVRLAIMMSIYWLVLSPLTYLAQVDKADVSTVSSAISTAMDTYEKEDEEKFEKLSSRLAAAGVTNNAKGKNKRTNDDLLLTGIIRNDPEFVKDCLPSDEYEKIEETYESIVEKDKEANINYLLFGNKRLDLIQMPKFSFNILEFQLIWLIPICAFLAQILTGLVSSWINKRNNPDAPSMMGMMLMMPLISLFIGFNVPGGVGFYWICSSLIGGAIQSAVQLIYGPHKLLARERAKEILKQNDFESKQLEKFNNPTVEE